MAEWDKIRVSFRFLRTGFPLRFLRFSPLLFNLSILALCLCLIVCCNVFPFPCHQASVPRGIFIPILLFLFLCCSPFLLLGASLSLFHLFLSLHHAFGSLFDFLLVDFCLSVLPLFLSVLFCFYGLFVCAAVMSSL